MTGVIFWKRSLVAAIAASVLSLFMAAPVRAEVDWMDILADPDNQRLNQQFISERLAGGDLPAALSAVERLVNQRPADVGLRLIRAEILVNLGNDTLATGELEALGLAAAEGARGLSQPQVAEADVLEWLELSDDGAVVTEERERLGHTHLQDIADGHPIPAHLECGL